MEIYEQTKKAKCIKENDCQSFSCMKNRLKSECEREEELLSSRSFTMQIKGVEECKCKPGGNAMMLYELNCKSFSVCGNFWWNLWLGVGKKSDFNEFADMKKTPKKQ